MILTANHHDALHASVIGILQAYEHALHSPQDVADSISAVFAVVHEACADFKYSFNCSPAASKILKLPDELIVSIFYLLEFEDRMAASQVCRTWRAVAVSACTLWSDIELDYGIAKGDRSLLGLLLVQRSHPAPFHLTFWMGATPYRSVSPDLCAAIRDNMWRLESYYGPGGVALNLGLHLGRLPSLTSLELRRSGGTLAIPELWGGDGTPRLTRLKVLHFTFPLSFAPFTGLRHFSGQLSPDGDEAVRLFELCPNLRSLRLWDVNNTSVLPQCPFPSSLKRVSLEWPLKSPGPHDPTRPVSAWQGYPLRRLSLDAVDNIEPVVKLFTLTYHDTWSLFIAPWTVVLGTANGFKYSVRLNKYNFRTSSSFPALAGYTGKLERLTIKAASLHKLYSSRPHLPALVSFQILFCGETLHYAWMVVAETQGHIAAPMLRMLDLAWISCRSDAAADSLRYDICQSLPLHLRDLLSFDAAVLQRLTLTLTGPPKAEPSTAALAALAQEFVIIHRYDLGDGAFDDVTTFPADPTTLMEAM